MASRTHALAGVQTPPLLRAPPRSGHRDVADDDVEPRLQQQQQRGRDEGAVRAAAALLLVLVVGVLSAPADAKNHVFEKPAKVLGEYYPYAYTHAQLRGGRTSEINFRGISTERRT